MAKSQGRKTSARPRLRKPQAPRSMRRNATPVRTAYVVAQGSLFKIEGKRAWDAILKGVRWQDVARLLKAEYNYNSMRWVGLPDALAQSSDEGSYAVWSTRSGVEVVRMDEADDALLEIAWRQA